MPISSTRSGGDENPLSSACSCVVFSARDWGLQHRDAWLYGIVVGWDDALGSIASKHGWSVSDTARLRRLRERYIQASTAID